MKCSARSWYSRVSLAPALLCAAGAVSASELPRNGVAATQQFQPALLAVSVNGSPAGEPTMLLMAGDGSLYAPEDALKTWRLKPWRPAFVQDGIAYYALDGSPGLTIERIEATQTLRITAAPELLEKTIIAASSREPIPMTPTKIGAFVNYDLVAQQVSGKRDLNGLLETGVFTPYGVGLSSFAGQSGDQGSKITRLETSWTIDDAENMRLVRLGDSISRGGLGSNPVRFAGIQIARDFSTQPGFVTIPLPTVGGTAEVPSIVDVYVNNVLTRTRELAPGPFEIQSVPVITGGGEVQLVVRDLLGRQTLVTERYYTASPLLRRGLSDYSFEAGFLRQDFGRSSAHYGPPMTAATWRYGLTAELTGELHGEASPEAAMGGVGASVAVADLGLLNASAAISHSDRGVGTRYELGFESRTPHLSYGAIAELISDDFVTVGSDRLGQLPPRLTVQAFAGIPLTFGSLGFSYILRDARGQGDLELLGASASIRLGRWGTLYLTGRKSLRGPAGDALLVSLTTPLGAAISATAGAELQQDNLFRLSLQKSLPAGEGLGFRAAAQLGALSGLDGRLSYQTDFGTYDLDLSWMDSRTGVRMSASGGIGIVGDDVFASRKLMQSFATVKVGDYAGVRVYADNQLVGTTNGSGVAVIPRLRPFEKNTVRIETADLPIDAEIDASEQTVRPYDRSGIALEFGVRPARGALVTLVRESGAPVPAGASVHLNDSSAEFVVAPGGEAYLTGLDLTTRGTATWPSGSCTFEVSYPEHAGPQPRLGPLACQENNR